MAIAKKFLTKKTSAADPLPVLDYNECLRTAERQRARATEMIETARDMADRAAEMRKPSRPLRLP